MKAGRELDALVAEKVMGEKPSPRHTWDYTKFEKDGHGGFAGRLVVPLYSTDIAAAWLIKNRMAALGWTLAMSSPPGQPPRVVFIKGRSEEWIEAETDALAICLAALHALGIAYDHLLPKGA